MVFAMTLAPGTHAMWLRYWLAAGGIDPEKDVALITVPPPQMVANMRAGRMDGCCVGEPWNARAIADGLGFTAILTEEIWPDHPEKVLAFTEEFAEANPNSVKAAAQSAARGPLWCDDRKVTATNWPRCSRTPIPCLSAKTIKSRLGPVVDCGDGRTAQDLRGLTFSRAQCNYPQPKYAVWWLSQFRRWKMLLDAPDYLGVAGRVMRPDFYEAAMQELGVPHGGAEFAPETLFDGKIFDPAEPEEYAASFEITALRK